LMSRVREGRNLRKRVKNRVGPDWTKICAFGIAPPVRKEEGPAEEKGREKHTTKTFFI